MPLNESPCVVFLFATAVGGFASACSVLIQPAGVFAPGVIFGLAIAYAINRSVCRIDIGQTSGIAAGALLAYWCAGFTGLFSQRWLGQSTDFLSNALAGCVAGTIGALVVALFVYAAVAQFRSVRFVLSTALAGHLFGGLFLVSVTYLSDELRLPHPIDDFIGFPLWQAGLGTVIGLNAKRSSPMPESDA